MPPNLHLKIKWTSPSRVGKGLGVRCLSPHPPPRLTPAMPCVFNCKYVSLTLMNFWVVEPVSAIREFLKEFKKEIDEYREKSTNQQLIVPVNEIIPGDSLFDTNLNLLLDVYESPLGLKSDPEIPQELKLPFRELAIISHFSLNFKDEITNRNYFISRLVNSYSEMRFELHWAMQLRSAGNRLLPKFLNPHEDFDMLVTTPSGAEVEIECKVQSKEAGTRVERGVLNKLGAFQAEMSRESGERIALLIDCHEEMKVEDSGALIAVIRNRLKEGDDFQHVEEVEVNGKKFVVSLKFLGEVGDITTAEEAESCLRQYHKQSYQTGWIFDSAHENSMTGFSYTAVKSLKPNRQLLNLAKYVVEASNYQFSGKRPSLVFLHLDAVVDVERVTNHPNFKGLFSKFLQTRPKLSGFIFSSIDVSHPSGEGYALGRFVPFANPSANNPIEGIEVPGLIAKEQFIQR